MLATDGWTYTMNGEKGLVLPGDADFPRDHDGGGNRDCRIAAIRTAASWDVEFVHR